MIKTIKEKITPIGASIDSEFEYNKKINIDSLFKFISNYLAYIDYLVLNDDKTDVVIYNSEIDEIVIYGICDIDVDRKKLNSIIKSKNNYFNNRMHYYNFVIHFEDFDEDIDFGFKYDKKSGNIYFNGTSAIWFYDEIKEYFNK